MSSSWSTFIQITKQVNTTTAQVTTTTAQVTTTTVQDTHQMKQSQYNQVASVQSHRNVHGTFITKNFTITHFTSLQNQIPYMYILLIFYIP